MVLHVLTCFQILVLVYFGPCAVGKSAPFKRTRKCNAYLWGVTSVTAGALCNAAILVSNPCLVHQLLTPWP